MDLRANGGRFLARFALNWSRRWSTADLTEDFDLRTLLDGVCLISYYVMVFRDSNNRHDVQQLNLSGNLERIGGRGERGNPAFESEAGLRKFSRRRVSKTKNL